MKKILLTTILGLGVAFSNMFALVDINRTDIQSKLENCISRNSYILNNIYDQLRAECKRKDKRTIFKEETNNNSPLIVGLQRIIPNAHIHYLSKYDGDFSLLVTKENVTLNDKFVITKPAKDVPYIRFDFKTDALKLVFYTEGIDNNDQSKGMTSSMRILNN